MTQTLTLSTTSTTSTNSSTASSKYNLSPTSTTPILLYTLHHTSTTYTTERDLLTHLTSSSTPLRCSRKPIPAGCSRLDIFVRDLFNEPERTRYSKYPNQDSNLVSVGLPRGVWWKRLLWGGYGELFIVSPEGSPNGGGSRGNSKKVSREDSGDSFGDGDSPTEATLRGAARKLGSAGD